MRRAEAKMGILREVIERVQNGEDVDVEKVLGTGVEAEEKEWAGGESIYRGKINMTITNTVFSDERD